MRSFFRNEQLVFTVSLVEFAGSVNLVCWSRFTFGEFNFWYRGLICDLIWVDVTHECGPQDNNSEYLWGVRVTDSVQGDVSTEGAGFTCPVFLSINLWPILSVAQRWQLVDFHFYFQLIIPFIIHIWVTTTLTHRSSSQICGIDEQVACKTFLTETIAHRFLLVFVFFVTLN